MSPDMRSIPWLKSLRCFAGQFGLAGGHQIEIREEIENGATMDAMGTWFETDPKRIMMRLIEMWKEGNEYFGTGPSRLMGDWPESSLLPE
jgi:hypothetical protein